MVLPEFGVHPLATTNICFSVLSSHHLSQLIASLSRLSGFITDLNYLFIGLQLSTAVPLSPSLLLQKPPSPCLPLGHPASARRQPTKPLLSLSVSISISPLEALRTQVLHYIFLAEGLKLQFVEFKAFLTGSQLKPQGGDKDRMRIIQQSVLNIVELYDCNHHVLYGLRLICIYKLSLYLY